MNEEKELPKGWSLATLQECSKRITDGTHQPPGFVQEGIPFIFVHHIVGGFISFENTKFISQKIYQELHARCPVELGDILYSAVGSYGVAVPVKTDRPFSFQRHIAHIKPSPLLSTDYLAYFLNSPEGRVQAHEVARGVAQKTVTLGDLARFKIPIAPYAEQQRIVAAIEQQFTRLDAGVAALKSAQTRLKRYRAAVLKAAVEGKLTEAWRAEHPDTEPASVLLQRILAERRARWEADLHAKGKDPTKVRYEEPAGPDTTDLPALPEGWIWVSVEQVARVQGGIQKQPSRAPKQNAFPYLRVANVLRGRLDLSEIEMMELFGDELATLRLEPSDLLVVEGNGSRSEIGRSALWNGAIKDCVHQNHIIRVRLQQGQPQYLDYYWNSPEGTRRVTDVAASTSGLYTLSVGKISRLPVPFPPLAEQEQTVAEVERRLSVVSELEATVEANLKRSERLRQSILREAFAGRLVSQDPNDEPASALLERISRERAGNGRVMKKEKEREAVLIEARQVEQVKAEQVSLWNE